VKIKTHISFSIPLPEKYGAVIQAKDGTHNTVQKKCDFHAALLRQK
jgi:hypothetical protein